MSPSITIPEGVSESELSIGSDGTVLAKGQNVGRIQLVNVRSPQNLESVGDNAYVTNARSGQHRRSARQHGDQAGHARVLEHGHGLRP